MDLIPAPSALTYRPAAAAQLAAIRRKVRGSDALVRLLAELSFGPREDGFALPAPVPTGARA